MISGPGPHKTQLHYRMLEAENLEDHLEEADGTPPADTSWRYRKDGAPKALALAGVVLGFVLMIIPGLIALRSFRRWEEGVSGQPTFAWSVAVLSAAALVAVSLFQVLPVVGVAVGILLAVTLMAFIAPRR